jgi:hypothetical protein
VEEGAGLLRTAKTTMSAVTAMAVPLTFTTMPVTTVTTRASSLRHRGQQLTPPPPPSPLPTKGTMTPAAMKFAPHARPLPPPPPRHCCLWQVRRRGSAYFSSSSDNKDEDKDNNDMFDDGNVVGREVGWR